MPKEELEQNVIYWHPHHPHVPKNPNIIHNEECQQAGFNQKIAVIITRMTGTMWTAYAFACLAILGFPAFAQWLGPLVAIYVIWVSQTFIQLTMLPVLAVGQNVLGRKAEIQADEMFKTTQRSFHDIEHIVKHLQAQDKELLRQSKMLEVHYQELCKQTEMLTQLLTPPSRRRVRTQEQEQMP